MNTKRTLRATILLAISIAFVGCAAKEKSATEVADASPPAPGRGVFGAEACDSGARVAVAGDAAYALYLDSDANLLDIPAEDLLGTAGNLMCATPVPESPNPGDPVACNAGYCPRVVAGKQICVHC